jgi:hypothetical protein
MSEPRLLRTIAYRRFGIFRARDCLVQRGITLPSDQIAAVAYFLAHGIGKTTCLGFVFGPITALEAEVRTILERTLDEIGQSIPARLPPLSRLALEVERSVVWDPYQDFAELLTAACGPVYARVASKLRHRFGSNLLDVADLTGQFALSALPQAVRKFDLDHGRGKEENWLQTVYYRYCLKRMLADLQSQRQLREMQTALVGRREEIEHRDEETPGVAELYEALESIPDVERRALAMYYGLEGREFTFAELGTELSCSTYHARAAVLRGFARLSALLRARGALDEQEERLVRSYFGEGKHLAAAAEDLRFDPDEARRVLARAEEKFSRTLRVRTRPHRARLTSIIEGQRKGTAMANTGQIVVLSAGEILKALRSLDRVPDIRRDEEGHPKVFLSGTWAHLVRVRDVLRQEPETLEELEAKAMPLDWLSLPDPASERADVPDDRAYLQDVFETLARRAFNQAQFIATLWLDYLKEKRLRLPDTERDDVVHSIVRVLGSISQAIETELPRPLRRRGEARFRIDRSKHAICGRWEDSDAQPLDVFRLAIHRASLLGDFAGEPAEELARIICGGLFQSEQETYVLPSFRVAETTQATVWLLWRAPSLVEELETSR